jgi:hypothetical protein
MFLPFQLLRYRRWFRAECSRVQLHVEKLDKAINWIALSSRRINVCKAILENRE